MGAKQSSANVTFSKPGASANKSGYVWVAPLGTAIPTDATTELDKAFVGLGYLSEDGLTEPASFEPGDDIVAAGGDTVAQADPTFSKTWTGTCIEALNEDLLKVAYGSANVTVTKSSSTADGSITIKEQAGDLEHHVIVIDEILKGGRRRRNVMADATFLITGDISHVHTALVNFEFTITAYPTEAQPAQTQYITIPKA
jgi:hypothetical protein|nr:MAG TPA: tail protein [Caudoviricetes sp.]